MQAPIWHKKSLALNTRPNIDIRTSEGYMQRFWELVHENRHERAPMKKALISLESELRQTHGVQRYSTYRSFATMKKAKPQAARLKAI